MSQRNGEPIAQFIDRFLHRTAIGVLLVALAYAVSAASYLVSDDLAPSLDTLKLLLSLSVLVVLLPVFVKFAGLRMSRQCDWSESDSYLAQVFGQACVRAFSAAFVLLIGVEFVSDRYLTDLPAAFFLNVVLSLSLGVLGLTFFYLIRSDDDESDDDLDTVQ